MKTSDRKKWNFTLIELLIVVAIIAILAGMLLPALASVREKARSVQCSSQQKQLAMAHIAYTDDNKSYFAPNCVNNSLPADLKGKVNPRWWQSPYLYPYIDGNQDSMLNKLRLCPSTNLEAESGHTQTGRPNTSYGMVVNTSTFQMKRWKDSLSRALMMMDYGREGYWYYNGGGSVQQKGFLQYDKFFTSNEDKAAAAVFTRHSDRANLSFADGHVENMARATFDYYLTNYTYFTKIKN